MEKRKRTAESSAGKRIKMFAVAKRSIVFPPRFHAVKHHADKRTKRGFSVPVRLVELLQSAAEVYPPPAREISVIFYFKI